MRLLEQTEKYRVDTEVAAKDLMEQFRAQALEKGYTISKCGYTYKTKKDDECYVVSVTKSFYGIWED